MRIVGRNLHEVYAGICLQVAMQGRQVSPRGQLTSEVMDAVIILRDPTKSLPTGQGRKLVPAIGIAESLQLIAGVSRPELMKRISPRFEQFMDGGRFWAAYGERVGKQVGWAIDKIKNDRDTRQAVITLWQPDADNTPGMHDYPCTVSLMFMVRDDKLQLHVTMRSNDVWWGLAYDAFQFTQLQLAVAHCLDLSVGPYHHHAVSLHAYERDWENIESLSHVPDEYTYPTSGIGSPGMSWSTMQSLACDILDGQQLGTWTESELWMSHQLRPYR